MNRSGLPGYLPVLSLIIVAVCVLVFGCSSSKQEHSVVIYTSLDRIFSEPILKEFEQKTGIKVKCVYDTEITKTTGLVNRLIAEKNNPQADVFWNSEIGRIIVLKKKGILAPYYSSSAEAIPDPFKDKEGYWTGFAARARVLVYNRILVKPEDVPQSIFELTQPKWRGKVALANPLFGTTATHVAALFVGLGEERAKEYLQSLKTNGVVIVDGNITSARQVADEELMLGFTDTDDANVVIREGKPVGVIYPDKKGIGTLIIPNTVGMIAGCPHPQNARKLIDYLLSAEVEERLAHSNSVQMPLRPGVKTPDYVPSVSDIKAMNIDFERVASQMETAGRYTKKLFIE